MSLIRKIKKQLQPGWVETDLSPYYPVLQAIRDQEQALREMPDHALRQHWHTLKSRAEAGAITAELLPEGFALVSEAAFRTLGMRPFDGQVLAALALQEGRVVEMQTGEGKTLTATLPAVRGERVHVHTFNAYLARRDARWMQPLYRFLGIAVGYIQQEMPPEERQQVYQNTITYLTAKEGGFDYLRSFQVQDPAQTVQPQAHLAIIDEVDSLLIDEARIPLVIAGALEPAGEGVALDRVAELVKRLRPQQDFQTDVYKLNIFLTEPGIKRVEEELDCIDLYNPAHESTLAKVNLALQAQWLLQKDVDYLVREEMIELIDEFTGRVVADRKWPHGLQAAIEAKEGLPVQPAGKILGKTTLQHFFGTYPRLCGMTGTARPAAEEFATTYGLRVTVIPPNKPSRRTDHPDLIFLTKEAKLRALVEEIDGAHQLGRPVLIGTASVEESEELTGLLGQQRIECQVLNAKNDEQEAEVIARAGKLGAVTISTNMAGRGTDIKLGGEAGTQRERLLALGGLYVIGTNRFESGRIDLQLRGRAGRQGDPGESRFFVSLEDELLQKHGLHELIPGKYRHSSEMLAYAERSPGSAGSRPGAADHRRQEFRHPADALEIRLFHGGTAAERAPTAPAGA
ncbi:hypothetical protein BH24BAC1_BH24BAC1_26130 [soil metagenome]